MIEEIGTVTSVAGDRARVARNGAVKCGSCATNGQCGMRVVQGFFGRRQRPLDALDPIGTRPGDRVVVGISEQTLQLASWIGFLLPLCCLFVGAMLSDWLTRNVWVGELAAITGGLTGLIAGLVATRTIANRLLANPQLHAKILRVIGEEQGLDKLSRAPPIAAASEER